MSAVSGFLADAGGRGVYTAMRSVNRVAVFSYDSHLRRLTALRNALEPDRAHANFDMASTEQLVTPLVRDAMRTYIEKHPDEENEMKISLALRVKQSAAGRALTDVGLADVDVFVAIDVLRQPRGFAVVEIALHGGRDNPTVKHADWIAQRAELEKAMRPECNEVLLCDEGGHILEGLSSNFAVLDETGCLVTAPDALVLRGTVLEQVLAVCARLQIPVRRECPTLESRPLWTAAFVMSTSRLVLVTDAVWLPDGHTRCAVPVSPRALLIRDAVRAEIEKASTKLL